MGFQLAQMDHLSSSLNQQAKEKKFWLNGPKAFTSQFLIHLPGPPRNIKKTLNGDFWVSIKKNNDMATGVKINKHGKILKTLSLDKYYNTTWLNCHPYIYIYIYIMGIEEELQLNLPLVQKEHPSNPLTVWMLTNSLETFTLQRVARDSH